MRLTIVIHLVVYVYLLMQLSALEVTLWQDLMVIFYEQAIRNEAAGSNLPSAYRAMQIMQREVAINRIMADPSSAPPDKATGGLLLKSNNKKQVAPEVRF